MDYRISFKNNIKMTQFVKLICVIYLILLINLSNYFFIYNFLFFQ